MWRPTASGLLHKQAGPYLYNVKIWVEAVQVARVQVGAHTYLGKIWVGTVKKSLVREPLERALQPITHSTQDRALKTAHQIITAASLEDRAADYLPTGGPTVGPVVPARVVITQVPRLKRPTWGSLDSGDFRDTTSITPITHKMFQ